MQPLRSAFTLGLVALFAVGCSLLLDTAEATQCATQRDCDSNPSLRNRVCVEGFCVAPERETGTTNPADEGCESTEKCTLANSNQLSVCPQTGGPCIVWQTEQCSSPINPAARNPNAIMIGSILPLTIKQLVRDPAENDYAVRVRQSIDLALEQFLKQLNGGILFPDGKVRPIAVVHCDSSLDPDRARLALQHLTQVVGVKALIVGADEDIAAIANEPSLQGKPVACSDCIGDLPPGPLAWRIVPRLALEAPMVAWRVAQLETQIRSLPSAPADIKVGLLLSQERATAPLFAKLQQVLRFNGNKTTAQNGARFRVFAPPDPRTNSVTHQTYIDQITAFEPDILIVAMGSDFTTYYLPGVEAKWTGARRPQYITTSMNYLQQPFAQVVGKSEDLRKRISGTRPGYQPELQANVEAYDDEYRLRWNTKDPDGAHSGFDALYALGMAILSTRQYPTVAGAEINAGFQRLLSGPVVDFRPADIPNAAVMLGQANATVDVRGLWSNLSWNVTTRDFDADVSMYCLKRDESNAIIIEPNAGPHLTTPTGVVDGVYSCD